MKEDIQQLHQPDPPMYLRYFLGHFWEIWGMFGEELTLHDVIVYQKTFAPAMLKSDMALVMRMARHALAFIRKMKDDTKEQALDKPLMKE